MLSDYQNGRDNEISIDNYIGLMIGLLHVSKYLDGSDEKSRNASTKATKLIKQFFKYLMNSKFRVERPDGERVKRGDDARGFVTLLHGLYKKATGDDVFDQLEVEFIIGGNQEVKWVGSVWDAGGLLSPLLMLLGQSVNAFTLHMAYSLLCSTEVWSQQRIRKCQQQKSFSIDSIIFVLSQHRSNGCALGQYKKFFTKMRRERPV